MGNMQDYTEHRNNGINKSMPEITTDIIREIIIQEMVPDDYREVYKLWENTPGVGLSNADTYENICRFLQRNKGLSHVCRHKGKIIGTILCGHDGRRGYIYHVAVIPEYRGIGIGRRLVEKSLEKLREEGIDKCHLFVITENKIGNAFWSSIGWIKREDIFVYSRSIFGINSLK